MSKILKKIEEGFTSILLLIITVLLFINVILRIFGFSLDWAEEFSRYSIIWITFIGSSMCIYKGAHIGIDSIHSIISKTTKKYLKLLTIIISLIFTGIFIFKTFNLVKVCFITGQLSSTLEVPIWLVYLAMPVGGLLMFIRFIQDFIRILNNKNLEGDD